MDGGDTARLGFSSPPVADAVMEAIRTIAVSNPVIRVPSFILVLVVGDSLVGVGADFRGPASSARLDSGKQEDEGSRDQERAYSSRSMRQGKEYDSRVREL